MSKHRALLLALVLGAPFAAHPSIAADCGGAAPGESQSSSTPAPATTDKSTQTERATRRSSPPPPVQPVHIDLLCPAPIVVPIGGLIKTQLVANEEPRPAQADQPPEKRGNNNDAQASPHPSVYIAQGIELIALAMEIIIVIVLIRLGVGLLNSEGLKNATDALLFRRYWGGFGGEASGWNISAALGKCLAGLLLITLAAALTVQTLWVLHKFAEQETTASDKVEHASGTGQTSPAEDAPRMPSAVPSGSPALSTAAPR